MSILYVHEHHVCSEKSCKTPGRTPIKHQLCGLQPELGTRYLKRLLGKKSSGVAAYRYSNEKVALLPLPLLACKTAAAAATLNK